MRSLFDADDFCQQVWADFFGRWLPEANFETPGHLRAFLIRLAYSRVADEHRQHLQTQKRDLRRHESLTPSPLSSPGEEPVSLAPSPEQEAAARDEREFVLSRLPPRQREAAALLLDGRDTAEVVEALDLHETTVRRTRQHLGRLPGATRAMSF